MCNVRATVSRNVYHDNRNRRKYFVRLNRMRTSKNVYVFILIVVNLQILNVSQYGRC